jgi:Tfp pilus assembly protein PilV
MHPTATFRQIRLRRAFTLLEVMIAMGIFFMCIFSILALVSMNLRNARLLQQSRPDAGIIFTEAAETDRFKEGEGDGDFDAAFPNFNYATSTNRFTTNGMFKVDVIIRNPAGGLETNFALFFRPNSPQAFEPR